MSLNPFPAIGRGLRLFWRALDATRRTVFNLLLLAALAAALYFFAGGAGLRPLPARTTLVLDLRGQLVEQHSGNALLARLGGEIRNSVQLHELLTVLDAAARDPAIVGVLLVQDELEGGGFAMRRDIGAALERLRASGKRVTAWGAHYSQRQYLLAAHADEVYMDPMGVLLLEGFGRYRNYYRDALDKLGVNVHLLRAGTYKSFGEPFVANGPSAAAAEAEDTLNRALWATYTSDVERARKLAPGAVAQAIAHLPQLAAAAGGDLGQVALNARLIDGLKTRDQLRQLLTARGAADGQTYRQVSYDDYLARLRPAGGAAAVGVVVLEGEISDGVEPPGTAGGQTIARLIRRAREAPQVRAVVLRVDSPGGSAFGAELIRRELELTRAAGKPVVVSMGSVAASGGYWAALAADEVIADPATITGSIGVFTLLPTAERVIDKLGIHTAGAPTTWLGDASNPLRPLDPRLAQVIQGAVDHIYRDFTARAARARKRTPEQIDAVAQGRVWTGAQARERGLVDTLGGYGDALAAAARRAGLRGDYRVEYIERASSPLGQLIALFGAAGARALGAGGQVALTPAALAPRAARDASAQLRWLSALTEGRQPFVALTHCLCDAP